MGSVTENLHELIGKNAALLAHARGSQRRILSAAEQECARLSDLIDGASHAALLIDDNQAEAYQSHVMQRAALLRLIAASASSTSIRTEFAKS